MNYGEYFFRKAVDFFKTILFVLLSLTIVACGSNGGENAEKALEGKNDPPPTIPPSTLTLALTQSTVTVSNQSTVSCSNGTAPFTWSIVSGPATTDADGLITPTGSGTVVVSAIDSESEYGSIQLTVVPNLSVTSANFVYLETQAANIVGGVPPVSGLVQSGSLSLNGTSVTAGSTQGTGSILWTDALGNQSSVNYSIEPPVAATASLTTLSANGTSMVSATGGYPAYTFSVQSGGGAVDSATGVFTAPSGASTSVIRALDQYGHSSTVTITTLGPPLISPAPATLAVNNTTTFTTTGGSSPYTYSIVSGGGVINSTTGFFTAPASPGTTIVRATDSLGGTSESTITVNAALALSPLADSVSLGATKTFSATGGVPNYTFSITSGGGSINSSTGVYTAPGSTGTANIQVTDTYGNTASTTINIVNSIAISPTSITLAVNNNTTFTASGGSAPYTYSVFSGGGSVNSSTGVYTAGATAGSATVRVTDQFGATSDATVTINPALAISPTNSHMLISTTKSYSATGGVSPYTYSVIMGLGSVNSSSGLYTADATAGAVSVQVQDSLGNISSTGLTVVTPVVASPSTVSISVNNTTTISASGGQSPYTYSIASGDGSVNSTTGVYTAPGAPGTAEVLVTDALGYTGISTITINGPLTLSPLNSFVNISQTKQYTGSGGVPPYSYAVTSGSGSIDSAGLYTAPATSGTATIQITDAAATTVSTQLEILEPLTLTSPSATLLVNNTLTVVGAGGKAALFYSVVSGGGSINASTGLYTAPATASTVVLRVTDSLSQTADVSVAVYEPLQISPTTQTILPSSTLDLETTGGYGTVTFSIVSGAGSINSASGLYTATTGSYSVVIRATDSLSATADANITVNAALSLSPASFKMSTNSSWTFTASNGGGAPFVYSIVSGGGSINSSTGVYTSGSTAGSVTIRVTDAAMGTVDALVSVVQPSKIHVGPVNNCVQYSDNSLRCWGDGSAGQLGEGNVNDRGDAASEMGNNMPWIDLGTGRTVKDVSIGGTHICAILDNDSIKCWGGNANGQLGLGDVLSRGDTANEMGDSLPVVNLGTSRTAKKIKAGVSHTCAILDNNTVKCWGLNGFGQLGQGNKLSLGDGANEMGDSLTAISLGTGRTALDLAVGSDSSCAILDNNIVKCWGRNASGQLGQGNKQAVGDGAGEMGDNLTAILIGTGRTTSKIVGGNLHYCALLDDSSMKCWGEGGSGELGTNSSQSLGDGNGEMGDNLLAISLGTGLTAQTPFSAPASEFNCTIFTNGSLKCWGLNAAGQLGQGNTTNRGDTANEMGNNLAATDLGAGFAIESLGIGTGHACAMSTDKTVKCWGAAVNGVLGNSSTTTNLGDGASEMGSNLPLVGI